MKSRYITGFIFLIIFLVASFFFLLNTGEEINFYRVQLNESLKDKKNFLQETGTGKIYFVTKKKKYPLNDAFTNNGCYFRLIREKKVQIPLPKKPGYSRLYSYIYFQGFNKKKITFQLLRSYKNGTTSLATIHKRVNSSMFIKDVDLSALKGIFFEFKGDGIVFFSNPIFYKVKIPEKRKHVFLIGADTLRADHIGLKVNGKSITPNIDQFIHHCVYFKNAYAQSPWTLSSFMSLFTAQYEFNHQLFRDSYLGLEKPFLIEDIKKKFITFSFNGRGYVSKEFGYSRGYDHYQSSFKLSVKGLPNSGKFLFDAAVNLIKKTNFPDLFMFLHTYQLHQPYAPPEEFLFNINKNSKYRSLRTQRGKNTFAFEQDEELKRGFKELYQAEIMAFDHYFGTFIIKIKEMGIYDNSMIIFMSDHGEEFYEHSGWEHGHGVYDEQIKVPIIIKFPKDKFRDIEVKKGVEVIDILPTILDFYQISYSKKSIDGRSLIPVIENKEERNHIFSSLSNCWMLKEIPPKFVIIVDHFKIIVNYKYSKKDLAYFNEPPPVIGGIEIYDLDKDPLEKNNIASKRGNLIHKMEPLILKIKKIIKRNFSNKRKNKTNIGEDLRKQLETLGYF